MDPTTSMYFAEIAMRMAKANMVETTTKRETAAIVESQYSDWAKNMLLKKAKCGIGNALRLQREEKAVMFAVKLFLAMPVRPWATTTILCALLVLTVRSPCLARLSITMAKFVANLAMSESSKPDQTISLLLSH